MKTKPLVLSVVLNLFLGYLWILFINHVVTIVNTINNTIIVGGIFIVIGTALFAIIVKGINDQYEFTRPFKLAGIISFAFVVIIHVFIVNLV
ncbi:hypothetical protein SPD48_16575 [Pseudogracilibacillus sp. SE30717A]|uniref:hypothetical protein n=1 Tax=Pseudogracilibacillus sp. SE30717A TaxID=3098293 RepID=UPI00300E47C8